jgi:hypothetical protein
MADTIFPAPIKAILLFIKKAEFKKLRGRLCGHSSGEEVMNTSFISIEQTEAKI